MRFVHLSEEYLLDIVCAVPRLCLIQSLCLTTRTFCRICAPFLYQFHVRTVRSICVQLQHSTEASGPAAFVVLGRELTPLPTTPAPPNIRGLEELTIICPRTAKNYLHCAQMLNFLVLIRPLFSRKRLHITPIPSLILDNSEHTLQAIFEHLANTEAASFCTSLKLRGGNTDDDSVRAVQMFLALPTVRDLCNKLIFSPTVDYFNRRNLFNDTCANALLDWLHHRRQGISRRFLSIFWDFNFSSTSAPTLRGAHRKRCCAEFRARCAQDAALTSLWSFIRRTIRAFKKATHACAFVVHIFHVQVPCVGPLHNANTGECLALLSENDDGYYNRIVRQRHNSVGRCCCKCHSLVPTWKACEETEIDEYCSVTFC